MAEADLCLRPSEEQHLFEELNDFDFDYFNAITVLPYPAGLNMGVLPKIPIDFSAPYTPMRTNFSTDSKDGGPIINSNIDWAAIDGNRIPASTAETYPVSEDYMWRNKPPGYIRAALYDHAQLPQDITTVCEGGYNPWMKQPGEKAIANSTSSIVRTTARINTQEPLQAHLRANAGTPGPWRIPFPYQRRAYRVRIAQACEGCRQRRVKCDGGKPCKRCVGRKIDCLYSDRRPNGARRGGSDSSTSPGSASPSSSGSKTLSLSSPDSPGVRRSPENAPNGIYLSHPPAGQLNSGNLFNSLKDWDVKLRDLRDLESHIRLAYRRNKTSRYSPYGNGSGTQ